MGSGGDRDNIGEGRATSKRHASKKGGQTSSDEEKLSSAAFNDTPPLNSAAPQLVQSLMLQWASLHIVSCHPTLLGSPCPRKSSARFLPDQALQAGEIVSSQQPANTTVGRGLVGLCALKSDVLLVAKAVEVLFCIVCSVPIAHTR